MASDGTFACVVGEDACARVVRRDHDEVRRLDLPWGRACAIDLLPGDDRAALAFDGGAVGTLDLGSGAFEPLHHGHRSWVRMLRVSEDGRAVVSVSQDGVGLHHRLDTGVTTPIGDAPVAAAAFGEDGAIEWLDLLGRPHTQPAP
jgi:hypothetical protein